MLGQEEEEQIQPEEIDTIWGTYSDTFSKYNQKDCPYQKEREAKALNS